MTYTTRSTDTRYTVKALEKETGWIVKAIKSFWPQEALAGIAGADATIKLHNGSVTLTITKDGKELKTFEFFRREYDNTNSRIGSLLSGSADLRKAVEVKLNADLYNLTYLLEQFNKRVAAEKAEWERRNARKGCK